MRRFFLPLLLTWASLLAAEVPGRAQTPPAPPPSDSSRAARPAERPSFIPLPGPFYSPETKFGLAVFVAPVFRLGADSATRKSTARLLGYYTQEKQWSVQLTHTLFTPGERFAIVGDWRFYDYPIFYYGTGDRTRQSAESLVQYKLVTLNQRLLKRVGRRRLFAGGQYTLASIWAIDASRSDSLRARPPDELRPSTASGVGPMLLFDTRDRLTFPARGVYTELGATYMGVGGTWKFHRYTVDLRRYFSLNAGGTRVLALQAVGTFHAGRVPFRELAPLGGLSLLRGYYDGRYRGRQLMAAQAELRAPLWRRFGFVAFAGIGDVGFSLAEFGAPKAAGGVGLRFQFNRRERLNVRADYGRGQGGSSGFYFSIGEAF